MYLVEPISLCASCIPDLFCMVYLLIAGCFWEQRASVLFFSGCGERFSAKGVLGSILYQVLIRGHWISMKVKASLFFFVSLSQLGCK